ncbi:MAG: glycosyltransferase family 2 protein [Ignavibacteriales bacterium]|nr:glycosyltransferase family 2 protein [Ignavibacteriales bacterium]
MDLSIIIVNFNTKDLLISCLDSIHKYGQGIRYETIVVDNNSSDGSVSLIENKFPWVKVIRNNKNVGFASANNIGIANSSGRYILFLNSDTIINTGVLDSSVKYLDENSDVGILGCKILNPDGSVQSSARDFPTIWTLFLEMLAISKFLSHTGWFRNPWVTDYNREQDVEIVKGAFLLTRRLIIDQLGGFDERFFLYSEEQDFCFRVKKHWRIVYWPHGSIYHYEGGSSTIKEYSARFMLYTSEVEYYRKHYGFLYAFIAYLEMFCAVGLRVFIWALAILVSRITTKNNFNHVEKFKYYWYSLKHLIRINPFIFKNK